MTAQDISSSANPVFDNPYLYENILVNLRMQDLLRCLRVSHEWKDYIDGSRKLQQKLFFLPDDHKIQQFIPDRTRGSGCFLCEGFLVSPPGSLEDTVEEPGYLAHPLVIDHKRPQLHRNRDYNLCADMQTWRRMTQNLPTKSSCTRMLLTQPSVPHTMMVSFSYSPTVDGGFMTSDAYVHDQHEWMTWGNVVDTTLERLKAFQDSGDLDAEKSVYELARRVDDIEIFFARDPSGRFLYDQYQQGSKRNCSRCGGVIRLIAMSL
ncbi:Hypothetical protein D9617_25g060970 [Elsinoe fawcettii]|nr:Hypothetical protein D9617_25g060970 [Elsinoe fawcettii]